MRKTTLFFILTSFRFISTSLSAPENPQSEKLQQRILYKLTEWKEDIEDELREKISAFCKNEGFFDSGSSHGEFSDSETSLDPFSAALSSAADSLIKEFGMGYWDNIKAEFIKEGGALTNHQWSNLIIALIRYETMIKESTLLPTTYIGICAQYNRYKDLCEQRKK